MGLYEERVLPRLVELTCGGADMAKFRRRTVEGLQGRIVEVGFGSGLNAEVYPDEVTEVLAVEPSELARERSARHTGATSARIEFVGLDGAVLPIEDASCDGALATFTLCTIPDVHAALAELHRVVRPGGRFHFMEHGRAPDESVRTWQRRIEPIQKRLAGGCHLTRDPEVLVSDAGFDIVELEHRYVRGPKPWSYFTIGKAVRPD
ncbi:MAG: class I SAM-dependent methyltransferase [Microthrixaceae bacterium]